MKNETLTALAGVKVGHSSHPEKMTGCTVVMFEKDYPVAYVAHGGSPGTIATENLNDGKEFSKRNGLFVAGGSMNGLAAYASITRELIKRGDVFQIEKTYLPVLSGAVIWDLSVGDYQFDPEYGAEALANISNQPVIGGNRGAGTGACVGKFQWLEGGKKMGAMKTGVGSARADLANGAMICVLSVVNALGNIINQNGSILAGNRDEEGDFKSFCDTTKLVTQSRHTTISIVGTNLKLQTQADYRRIAEIAAQGQVRAIQPVNTSLDGDTVFVFSNEIVDQPLNKNKQYFEGENWPGFSTDIIGNIAADVVRNSIYDAARQATTIEYAKAYQGIIPAADFL